MLAFASLTTNAYSVLSKALVIHLFTPIFHSIPIRHHPSNLTLNLLTTTIVAPPSNASKWQMGFNSAFKGLI